MGKSTYSQYQSIVRKRAWTKFTKEWAIKGTVFSLLAGLIAGIVGWVMFGEAQSLILALAVLGVFFLAFMVFYLGFFHRESVTVYNEQNNTIARLEKRAESTTIKTSKITITPGVELPKKRDGYYYAYLEVSNGEANDLRDCFSSLEDLKISIQPKRGFHDWLHEVTVNTCLLTWPRFKPEDEKIVRRTKTARINIAKMAPGYMPFLIFEDGREEQVRSKLMYIEVSLNGEIKGKPIEEILFTGFLKREEVITEMPEMIVRDVSGKQTDLNKVVYPSHLKKSYRFYIEPGELQNEKDQKTA
jgi:hypothetical protein